MMEEKTKDTSEETTEEDVETPEPVEEEEETTEDESSSTIDYDAITKEEEGRKPDPDKAKEAFKQREKKREEEEEDKPESVTIEQVQNLIQSSQQVTNKTLLENNAVTIAGTLSESPEEANAILAKWRNYTFPEGMSLHEQLEDMHAVVNKKKNLSKNSELKRALLSKDNVSKDTAGTHRDAPEGDVPKLSPADAQGMKSAGLKWDGVKSVWWKPIGRNKRYETKGPGQPHQIVDR